MTIVQDLQSKLVECCPDILRDPVKPVGNSRMHEPQTGLTTHCIGTTAQCINSPVAFTGGRHNQKVCACLVRAKPSAISHPLSEAHTS